MTDPVSDSPLGVAALRERLERGEPTFVLDVRPSAERTEWAIPGSVHVDAYAELRAGHPEVLASVEVPSGVPVVTVCAAGKTSQIAAAYLRARGIPARSLAGGMKAWSLAWNTAEVALPESRLRIIQVRRTGKGCLSYVLGSTGEAAVIDASLPADVYLDMARAHGWVIRSVLETHLHADHLSRGRDLAARSGARFYLPRQNRISFRTDWIDDDDVVNVGQVPIRAVRTPGHTEESTCYLVSDRALLTGDTLFLDSVGRPDLKADAGEADRRARWLYASLERLLRLDAGIVVLPGHTGAPVPFDGRPLMATLDEVRNRVAWLHQGVERFVDQTLRRIPAPPPHYAEIVQCNQGGTLPDTDPTELEAGANRCAVSGP